MNLLFVDDEEAIRVLTKAIYTSMGFTVFLAVDGNDAIEMFEQVKPDIVVTDLNMPNKNGFELCKFIRNHPVYYDTPIIIISALGDYGNKLNGFNEGADDYITKPFNVDELKARTRALLQRYQKSEQKYYSTTNNITKDPVQTISTETISSGFEALDIAINGGIRKGSNLLITGQLGAGKSTFIRHFLSEGLKNNEKCLMVTLDDDPQLIKSQLIKESNLDIEKYEKDNVLKMVDAYSWSSLSNTSTEKYAITGMLDLNQLSGVISDASHEIGQSIKEKIGGRRVIDSISSLLVTFDLPSVQRFITQIARTAGAFGDVTTLFTLEEGTVSQEILNNIKYVMDGVIEFKEDSGDHLMRVSSMKWNQFSKDWIKQ